MKFRTESFLQFCTIRLLPMFLVGSISAVIISGQNPQPSPQPSPQPTQQPQPTPSQPTTPTSPPTQQQPQQTQTNPTQPANPTNQPTVPSAAGQKIGDSRVVDPLDLPLDPPPIEPNFERPARPLPSAERIGVDVADQTPLTLNEAIALALENNNDIETTQIDVRISEFDLTAARGVYDPRITGESFFQRSTQPTASTLGSSTGSTSSTSFNSNLGLNGFSPFAGGSYQARFNSSRQTTDAPFTSLNPQFPTSLTFSYTQPLFRGRRIDENRRRIQIARKNLSLTDVQFRQRAIEVITRVTQAYWDLAFALRNLQVQIDAVKQARTQAESNRRQVEQGVIAPIDIVAADTQVTNFEQNVYSAQEQVTRAEATLKTLLLPDKNAPLWSRAIIPTTPVSLESPPTAFNEALNAALNNRPEIEQLQTNKEINEINNRFFRDQTKPQIDLVGTFTSAGLAGSTIQDSGTNPLTSGLAPIIERVNLLSANGGLPPIQLPTDTGNGIPNNLVGGYFQSLQNLFGLNYPTFQIGVRVDFPFGNRTARANLGRSLAEGTRIENQRAQTEQQIRFEVQTSLQTLRSAEARLASAAASRASSEQLYASEQRRYANGTSTVFLVLQRQQELIVARSNELRAQTDLNKAIADFQRSIGNTFAANNINIISATSRRLEMAVPYGDGFTPSVVRSSLRQTKPQSSSSDQKP